MTRVVLVTGKGGVGKTTTAAATAVRAARSGLCTLVMSTDAAHSLGDALDVALTTASTWRETTEVEPGLHALAVGAHTAVEADWQVVRDYLLGVLDAMGVDAVVADELTSLPGAEEVTALAALAHQAESGQWDLVVVDCAPTAETLRLLALPEVLGWHLDRLLPAQRRLLTVLRPAASAATGVPVPGPEVLLVLRAWRELMVGVRTLLTSARASVRVVLTPERVVIAESRRVLTSLSLHGYAVDAVVVNRVLPDALPGDVDPWRTAWTSAQASGLEQVRESFLGIPLLCAPYLAGEPIGVDALDALAVATVADGRPAPALMDDVDVPRMRVEADGADFVLTLPLPLVSAGMVGMARREDDLLLEVGGQRRVVTLPSVLRRCIVQNAAVGSGELRVRFERDEELWASGR
jgi:arsenite/tail-anchored protein-transporting ATPase